MDKDNLQELHDTIKDRFESVNTILILSIILNCVLFFFLLTSIMDNEAEIKEVKYELRDELRESQHDQTMWLVKQLCQKKN